jgi:hypothetical protein
MNTSGLKAARHAVQRGAMDLGYAAFVYPKRLTDFTHRLFTRVIKLDHSAVAIRESIHSGAEYGV